MCVIKVEIVNNGESISFFVLLHKKERKNLVLRIQNPEEHQNYMIGSKVTTILTVFLSMINSLYCNQPFETIRKMFEIIMKFCTV